MIHLGEGFYLIGLAVTVGIDAADYTPAAFLFTKTTLFIDAHEHLARGGGREADGIVHLRGCGEQFHLKPFRCLHARDAGGGLVAAVLGSLHHLARQLGQGASVRFKFPQAAPHAGAGTEKGDLEKLRSLRVDLMGRDLFDVLVVRLVDDLLPVLAVGGSLDGVTIGGVVFLPNDADILNVRRFLELNL